MNLPTTLGNTTSLLQLPPEIRVQIYKCLLCTSITQTQKSCVESCRSGCRYLWNLQPAILAVSHQIHEEARNVLGRENDFIVVECATRKLEQAKRDLVEEIHGAGSRMTPTTKEVLNVWPGRKFKHIQVPHERMRIRLVAFGKRKEPISWCRVVLQEELLDLCAGLSTFLEKFHCHWTTEPRYRVAGLSIRIALRPPRAPEIERDQDIREARLLYPVMKLRLLKDVEVVGAAANMTQFVSEQLRSGKFDRKLLCSTCDDIMSAGDLAGSIGHHSAVSGYYSQASDYLHHFKLRYLFTNSVDPVTLEFRLKAKRARSWLELLRFDDALEAMRSNLSFANSKYLTCVPTTMAGKTRPCTQGQSLQIHFVKKESPPTLASREHANRSEFRKWSCARFNDAAPHFDFRITTDEIGRCYMYKSIAERCAEDDETNLEADEDKLMAVECCMISHTAAQGCVDELLEFERHILQTASSKRKQHMEAFAEVSGTSNE